MFRPLPPVTTIALLALLSGIGLGCKLTAGAGATSSSSGAGGAASSSGATGGGGATTSGSAGGTTSSSGGTGGSGCTAPHDCPGTDTECGVRSCTNGACGMAFVAAGTPSMTQITGDCHRSVCDGNGNLVPEPDPTDPPASTNPCIVGSCQGNVPQLLGAPAGTACNQGSATVCDGAGACVQCLNGAQCTSGVCTGNACQAPTCGDGVKNGSETDVDCGSPTCPPCANGKTCVGGADCASHVCSGGVCISMCSDGVKDGMETDVDCGGPACAACADGKKCAGDADCANHDCSAGVCGGLCADGVKDGTETDVDCGGACTPCFTGKQCLVDTDCHMCPKGELQMECVPGRCVNGTCGAQALYAGACVTEWVVDATTLYWTCSGSGTVMSAPKDGSGPVTTLASGQAGPNGIAIDATQLYWTNSGDGTVGVAPLGASGFTTLASGLSPLGLIHVGGGYAWVMSGPSLVQIPVGGGAAVAAWTSPVVPAEIPTQLALTGIAVSASNVFWSTQYHLWNEPGVSKLQCEPGATYTMPLAGGPANPWDPLPNASQLQRLVPFGGSIAAWDFTCSTPSCGCSQNWCYNEVDNGPPLFSADGATDGVTLYWTGVWCLDVVVKKPGIPVGNMCQSFGGPLVDLPAKRIAVDGAYLYVYANGAISRAFK